jgi:hypothetical protein
VVHVSLRSRRRRALARLRAATTIGATANLAIWRDGVARLLIGVNLLGMLALVAYVSAWQAALPPLLPLHYNGLGSVDLIGPRTDLYKMPGIGGLVLVADLVLGSMLHRRERLAALTLLAAGVLVQVMLIVATVNIVRLAFGD